jgi:hypothetical protein
MIPKSIKNSSTRNIKNPFYFAAAVIITQKNQNQPAKASHDFSNRPTQKEIEVFTIQKKKNIQQKTENSTKN